MSVYDKAAQRRQDAPEWKKILAKELLKPKLKRYVRRRVYASGVDAIWTADLVDVHRYARQNKGYKYILVVLDVFSRYAWARPLKSKFGVQVAPAFEDIFRGGRKPTKLWTDKGTEFYNVNMSHMLQTNGDIQLYSTYNEPKGTIAERFIRTLRTKIESHYIIDQQTVWYDILPQLLHEYNTTRHRSIKMTPEDACKPENFRRVYRTLYDKTYDEIKPMFNVGDKVRISVHKGLFEKGTTANWSEEIFEVREIVSYTRPITYRLKDLAGELVDGAFYNQQLQKTDQEIYRVDRVLRRRKKRDGTREIYVRWEGYPDKFNQWVPADDIYQSGAAVQNVD